MKMGAFTRALQCFGRGVEIDPNLAISQVNLATALVAVNDYSRAVAPARKALELDRGVLGARYALGLVALSRHDCTPEAAMHLQAAAEAFPASPRVRGN
jgi:Flp pilus assembly protein TadD